MNFLAHLYLSGHDDTELLIGNFIADGTTAQEAKNLPAGVQRGIRLHLSIDHFTDTHPVVAESKARLRPVVHKYAPVVADVFYDHFLAANWSHYSDMPLADYAEHVYRLLEVNKPLLPGFMQQLLKFMRQENWLLFYSTVEGMDGIFHRMARRTKFESNMEQAAAELQRHYELYRKEFEVFFPLLQQHCRDFLSEN